MQEEINKLFLASDCPSADVMQKYLSDTLSDQEKNAIERHVADCELCSDAIVGFSYLPNQVDLIKENKALTKRVESLLTDKKIKKENLALWAAAASVIIILGATILFFFVNDKKLSDHSGNNANSSYILSENNEKDQGPISMNNDLTLAPPSPEIRNNEPQIPSNKAGNNQMIYDSNISEEKTAFHDNDVMSATSKSEEQSEPEAPQANTAPLPKAIKETELKQNDVRSKMIAVTENHLLAFSENLMGNSTMRNKRSIATENDQKSKAKKSEIISSTLSDSILKPQASGGLNTWAQNLNHGIEKYKEKEYRHANEIFDELLLTHKESEQLILFSILTKIHLRKTKDALQLTQNLSSENYNSWRKWLLALIDIETNEDGSKKLLMELSTGNSEFSEEASSISESIK